MSETKNTISKMKIRSQLNVIFAMMKFLSTVLDMAQDNQTVQETLTSMAQGVSSQADALLHDIGSYVAALTEEQYQK